MCLGAAISFKEGTLFESCIVNLFGVDVGTVTGGVGRGFTIGVDIATTGSATIGAGGVGVETKIGASGLGSPTSNLGVPPNPYTGFLSTNFSGQICLMASQSPCFARSAWKIASFL